MFGQTKFVSNDGNPVPRVSYVMSRFHRRKIWTRVLIYGETLLQISGEARSICYVLWPHSHVADIGLREVLVVYYTIRYISFIS